MQAPNCLNCEHPLATGHHFCAHCGQKATVHRLSLHDVSHDAMHYFTHADKGIFSLTWQLLSKPGLVAREYVEGRRKKYFPPLNFFLVVAAISVFMSAMVYAQKAEPSRPGVPNVSQVSGQMSETRKIQMMRGANVTKFFSKYSNLVSMAAIPLISFIMWLFYIKGKYNYTEHLVGNMYIGGFALLVYALVMLPGKLVVPGNVILYTYFGFELVYRVVSYYYFMNHRNGRGVVMAISANLVAILAWVLLTTTIISLYIVNGLWGLLP